jgi:nucleotide-binding universal stress UspA family protein
MDNPKKIILISDISGESGSIIPWGLKLGKHTGSEVDILHIIDPREKHGVESPISDSRSITPGDKLTWEEILKREEGKAEQALDKLLSKEASRLNYPLKIKTIIETNHLEEGLKKVFSERHGSMLITSSEYENTAFTDQDELLAISRDIAAPVFIIPSGTGFQKPDKAFMLADYSDSPSPDQEINNIFEWLTPFSPFIYAGEVVQETDNYMNLELAAKKWIKGVRKFIDPGTTIETTLLKGGTFTETVENYVTRNKFDWIIIPKSKKEFSKKRYSPDISKKLIKSIDKPVLLYG